MKVYVLVYCDGFINTSEKEQDLIVGVFSTREKALEYGRETLREKSMDTSSYINDVLMSSYIDYLKNGENWGRTFETFVDNYIDSIKEEDLNENEYSIREFEME